MAGVELGIDYAARYGRADARAFADGVARTALDRYHLTETPWTCGLQNVGENSCFMLGIAGIGHGFLRAYDAEVPSLLVIAPPSKAGS
jgi:lantibiotic modifying enzyme